MLKFDSKRLSHAYITDGIMADTIAQTVICSNRSEDGPCGICLHCQKALRKVHPDIINLSKPTDKRDITVDQIRELKKDVVVVPNEAGQKAYIINDAHLMNISAQNAFLQILEEPPSYLVFILKTAFPTQLLVTILSRCVPIKSEQTTKAEANLDSDEEDSVILEMVSQFYSSLAEGNFAIAEFMFVLEKLNKEQFADFISSARNEAARLLNSSQGSNDKQTMKTIADAERLLVEASGFLDLNVSIGHISGFICANLINST